MATVLAAGCVAEPEPVEVVIGTPPGGGSGSGPGAPTAPVDISVTLSDRPNDPGAFSFFVAYRDGDGAWQLAPEPTGDIYTFQVTSERWGVVYGCKSGTAKQWTLELALFATSERTTFTRGVIRACTDRQPPPLASLTGTVTNLPTTGAGWSATYGATNASVTKVTTTSGSFDFTNTVRAGNRDLVAYHTVETAAPQGDYVDAAAIVRNVTAPNTSALVNWSNAGIKSATVTVPDATGNVSATTDLYTKTNTHVNLAFQTSYATGTATFKSPSLAASQTIAGDVYAQTVFSSVSGTAVTLEGWSSTVGDRTFTIPQMVDGIVSSVVATAPYPRVKTQWSDYPDAVAYVVTAQQSIPSASTVRTWNATIGAGYLDMTPSFELPDLSGLPGWKPELAFVPGTSIIGSVAAYLSTAGVDDVPFSYPAAAGTERVRVSRTYTVTP